MTDRAEIECLLNMTGRTLEGLPDNYDPEEAMKASKRGGERGWTLGEVILHQYDVTELLVGALRDALDKPMQKPLTLHQLSIHQGKMWVEFKEFSSANGWQDGLVETLFWTDKVFEGFKRCEYLVHWRCWASRPTDEEREAAAWES